MSAHSCVVLYGNSVFLAGIKAELELNPGIELIAGDARSPGVMEKIRDHKPRALLFDLAEGQPDIAFALLREQPHLLMIGVDPSSDELLVLSNQPVQALNLSDLIELIRIRCESGKERSGER
jgi:hypothetical protein